MYDTVTYNNIKRKVLLIDYVLPINHIFVRLLISVHLEIEKLCPFVTPINIIEHEFGKFVCRKSLTDILSLQ